MGGRVFPFAGPVTSVLISSCSFLHPGTKHFMPKTAGRSIFRVTHILKTEFALCSAEVMFVSDVIFFLIHALLSSGIKRVKEASFPKCSYLKRVIFFIFALRHLGSSPLKKKTKKSPLLPAARSLGDLKEHLLPRT